MKKIYTIISIVALLLTSCDSKLDIVPKGQSTLDTVDDLETLFNQNHRFYAKSIKYMEALCSNTYPESFVHPSVTLTKTTSLAYVYLSGDTKLDRSDLTADDMGYENLYKFINYCNVVESKIGNATGGTPQRKAALSAEARVTRAWYHFLVANIYAKQYDASTAAENGGIAYVDNTNVGEQKTKLSLAETYEHILADCSDEIIADLNDGNSGDPCRANRDFGYAVRAMALYQMKRYDEALTYGQKALAINSTMEDRHEVAVNGVWTMDYIRPFNYFMINHDNSNLGEFYFTCMTPELFSTMEPTDYILALGDEGWGDNWGYSYDGAPMCGQTDVHFNSTGIRTENIYYLVAECLIRQGKYKEGLAMVDDVRKLRASNPAPYADMNVTSEAEAMELYQKAKRLEMFNTVYNFFDRKRWNTESAYKKDIVHDCYQDGKFVITPESELWVFPFPKTATLYNASLTQNY